MKTARLLSVRQAAAYLGGISEQTIYGWVCHRQIPFVKVGRRTMFRIEDLDEFIERRRVQARGVWPRGTKRGRNHKTEEKQFPLPLSFPYVYRPIVREGELNLDLSADFPRIPFPDGQFPFSLNFGKPEDEKIPQN